MSIQHIALVLEAQSLCAQEKAVLTAFCNHTNPAGRTFAGEDRLMRESGMPRTTFQRWRGQLVTRGLLISRRKGRKGGGRATSDTWVNLKLLRSMRDDWFDGKPVEQDDEPNPFDAPSNGPVGGAEGGSNGPASGAINGPASGAEQAPPVEPVTLTDPQREPSETLFPTPPQEAAPSSPSVTDRYFDAFWDAYPRKIGKQEARRAWDKAVKRRTDLSRIVAFAAQQAAAWKANGREIQYIPHPSTWLNGSRYLDEIDTTGPSKPRTNHQPYQNPDDHSGYYESF